VSSDKDNGNSNPGLLEFVLKLQTTYSRESYVKYQAARNFRPFYVQEL
jgi:hypothetical protein